MEKSSTDECRTLLRDALQSSQYPPTAAKRLHYSTTTSHQHHPIRSADETRHSVGCQHQDVESIQQVTDEMTPRPITEADRKLLEARHKEEKDFESIVKIRLFLATAALWLVWLLVYVILSQWRLI